LRDDRDGADGAFQSITSGEVAGESANTSGSEQLVEAYRGFAVYKLLWLTADLQWLISGPNQELGGTNRHVLVPGVRAALLF
jgi:hypothetical protein